METGTSFTALEPDGDDRFQWLRRELGISTFGLSLLGFRPGQGSRIHRHQRQEEAYVVLEGTLTLQFDGETRELGPGGLAHVESTTPRQVTNVGGDDLVLLVVGGKDGYVGRDGKLVDRADLAKRQAISRGDFEA
jgi:uncharacterized cupin superfamily protein